MPANRGDYMTLTPEDVLNKNFTPTQFRRGYDEREVDDFLDEVVAEMRRIVKESDDLREQLNDCRQSKGMPAVAKPDANAQAKKAAEAKEAQEAEAKAAREVQERIAAQQAKVEQAEKAAQERIAAANAKAEEAEKVAQERAKEAARAADGQVVDNEAAAARVREAEQRAAEAEQRAQAAQQEAEAAKRALAERGQQQQG